MQHVPLIISKPYLISKSNPRMTKDYQYFTMEYGLGVLCALGYGILNEPTNPDPQDEYPSSPVTSNEKNSINVRRMSMGLWVSVFRTLCKEITQQKQIKHPLGKKICSFYQKNKNTMDEFVRRRNRDMHGNPIPSDKLNLELQERDQLLQPIISFWQSIPEYKILYLEQFQTTGDLYEYTGVLLSGEQPSIFTFQSSTIFPIRQTLFINIEDPQRFVSLSPLLLWGGHLDFPRLMLYGKQTHKNTLEYNSLLGHTYIEQEEQENTPFRNIHRQHRNFLYHFSSEERPPPQVEGKWIASSSNLQIEEMMTLTLQIENRSVEYDLQNVVITQILPTGMKVNSIDKPDFIQVEERPEFTLVKIMITEIGHNDVFIEESLLEFYMTEQGTYHFPMGTISYDYVEPNDDSEKTNVKKDEDEISGFSYEVRDANALDLFVPVINSYVHHSSNLGEIIEIGMPFEIIIELSNIGFATAIDIQMEMFLPDEFEIVSGHRIINCSQIDPQDTEQFRIKALTWKAGVYNLVLRDIIYMDGNKKYYLSSSTKGHHIFVRSNLLKLFERDIFIAYEDLLLEPFEKENLQLTFEKTPIDPKQYANLVVKSQQIHISNIFRKVFENQSYTESVIKDQKQEYLLFSVWEFPIFAILIRSSSHNDVEKVQCISLPCQLRYDAVQQGIPIKSKPQLKTFLFYKDVQENKLYGRPFFYQWFKKLLGISKKLLQIKSFVQELQHVVGASDIFFRTYHIGISFTPTEAPLLGMGSSEPIRVDVFNTDFLSIRPVFYIKDINIVKQFSCTQQTSPMTWRNHRLEVASRKTQQIGTTNYLPIKTEEEKQNALHVFLQVWDSVQKCIMKNTIQNAQMQRSEKILGYIQQSLQPLIEDNLGISLHVERQELWLYNRTDIASPVLVQKKDAFCIFRVRGAKVYASVAPFPEMQLNRNLEQSLFFNREHNIVFYRWNINDIQSEMDSVAKFIQQLLQSPKTLHAVLPKHFSKWMTEMISTTGYETYEILLQLQDSPKSFESIYRNIGGSKSRLHRILDEISDHQKEWNLSMPIINTKDIFSISPIYRTMFDEWLEQYKIVEQQIWHTLTLLQNELQLVFPTEEGWTIEYPKNLRGYSGIKITCDDWFWGFEGSKLSIQFRPAQGCFNNIDGIGISGGKSTKNPSTVHDFKVAFAELLSKQNWKSNHNNNWIGYINAGSIPEIIRYTGGANWKLKDEESQREYVQSVAVLLQKFILLRSDIADVARKYNDEIKQDRIRHYKKLYPKSYSMMETTEQNLGLTKYQLPLEIEIFTRRLYNEDWSDALQMLSWPWDNYSVQLEENKRTKTAIWGRMGIGVGSSSWKPGVFLGVLIDGKDHGEPLTEAGVELAVIISIHRSAGKEGLRGDDFIQTSEWLALKERLRNDSGGFQYIDHLEKNKPNRWHPIHLRIPLTEIWTDCQTEEDRYRKYHHWLRRGLQTVLTGGEFIQMQKRILEE